MSQSIFPTAQEVNANWDSQKQEILKGQAEDLQKTYGKVAEFGPNGPVETSKFKFDNWFTSVQTTSIGALGVVAVGAAIGSASISILGVLAVGKVVFDVMKRGHYNDAVNRFDKFKDSLQATNTPEEAAKALETSHQEVPEGKYRITTAKLMGVVFAGGVVALAASAAAPAIGLVAATAMGVAGGVLGGKAMGEAFKETAADSLIEQAQERARQFAERIGIRREAQSPTVETLQPSRPSGPN